MSERIFVTGHRGLLGSALLRALQGREVVTASRDQLDLRDHQAVTAFLKKWRPHAIIHAAARNGGLLMHERSGADLFNDNLFIATTVIRAARELEISRLIFISSAVVYSGPGDTPVTEDAAATIIPGGVTGGYAFAKIAGMKLCDAFHADDDAYCSVIPCNLYGPGDNYHRENATVLPGMMRRMHESKRARLSEFKIWGSGNQTREFLHADDLAAACALLLNVDEPPPRVNCSPGAGTTLWELAKHLKEVTGYSGSLAPDPVKPEGQRRPVLDCTLLRGLGWAPCIQLGDGLRSTYEAFQADLAAGTLRG